MSLFCSRLFQIVEFFLTLWKIEHPVRRIYSCILIDITGRILFQILSQRPTLLTETSSCFAQVLYEFAGIVP